MKDNDSAEMEVGRPELQRRDPIFLRARALEKARDWRAADAAYRQLLTQHPDHQGALLQRATVLHRLGYAQEALACLDRLIALDPLQPLAHCNRGAILETQQQASAATKAYQRALELSPALTQAAINLATLLVRAGEDRQADEVIQNALDHAPGKSGLRYQWARLLRQWGRYQEAVEMLRAILRTEPHNVDMLLELGGLLMIQGRFELAKICYMRLLRQQPGHRLGLFNLGQSLEALGQPEAAIRAHESALALDPGATEVLYQCEFLRLSLCDWEDYDERMAKLRQRLGAYVSSPDAAPLSPLRLLSVPAPMDLHLRVARQWAASFSSAMSSLPTSRAALASPGTAHQDPSARRVIRIGYLGADFRDHAMGRLIHGLFSHHDRRQFEVFAYSLTDTADAYTASIQRGVDHFHQVASDSAQAIAARIRHDGIDVLIDLMGHTYQSRPAVLALRPAPVQLLYLGYPGSMGADFIDGIIADDWLIPPHLEPGYRETVYRLPCAFVWSETPTDDDGRPATAVPSRGRAALGLPADAVVFACFNRAHKLEPCTFDLWLDILKQVPGSVLWLIQESPLVQQRLRARAGGAGVDAGRLVFTPAVPAADFSALCALADLFLDTAHYGAGATAVAALRAGLPVLTCPGETFASRMGASLCAATGLAELICPSPAAYQAKAVALANHPHALAQLRRSLLEQSDQLPLFQTARWVQQFESLLGTLVRGSGPG